MITFLSPVQKYAGASEPFEEPGFTKYVICNDNQASFWSIVDPDYVTLSDDTDVRISQDSQNSLKIDILSEREHYTIIKKKIGVQDWSNTIALNFWFKGMGSGESFSLGLFFNGSSNNFACLDFKDTSTEWRELNFSTQNPSRTHGIVDWHNVTDVLLGRRDQGW
ncbi:hypothetical protein ES703_111084 [subsurface metagenome]